MIGHADDVGCEVRNDGHRDGRAVGKAGAGDDRELGGVDAFRAVGVERPDADPVHVVVGGSVSVAVAGDVYVPEVAGDALGVAAGVMREAGVEVDRRSAGPALVGAARVRRRGLRLDHVDSRRGSRRRLLVIVVDYERDGVVSHRVILVLRPRARSGTAIAEVPRVAGHRVVVRRAGAIQARPRVDLHRIGPTGVRYRRLTRRQDHVRHVDVRLQHVIRHAKRDGVAAHLRRGEGVAHAEPGVARRPEAGLRVVGPVPLVGVEVVVVGAERGREEERPQPAHAVRLAAVLVAAHVGDGRRVLDERHRRGGAGRVENLIPDRQDGLALAGLIEAVRGRRASGDLAHVVHHHRPVVHVEATAERGRRSVVGVVEERPLGCAVGLQVVARALHRLQLDPNLVPLVGRIASEAAAVAAVFIDLQRAVAEVEGIRHLVVVVARARIHEPDHGPHARDRLEAGLEGHAVAARVEVAAEAIALAPCPRGIYDRHLVALAHARRARHPLLRAEVRAVEGVGAQVPQVVADR